MKDVIYSILFYMSLLLLIFRCIVLLLLFLFDIYIHIATYVFSDFMVGSNILCVSAQMLICSYVSTSNEIHAVITLSFKYKRQ